MSDFEPTNAPELRGRIFNGYSPRRGHPSGKAMARIQGSNM
jgi:hypothetical protein